MTSATDELRRLLDERGVEWWEEDGHTLWYGESLHHAASAFSSFMFGENERVHLNAMVTPEQAVEATLGRGTCRMEHLWSDDIDGVCWWCKACDKPAFTHGDFPPDYCPNCGAKVVE